jgi:uncharacterized protein
MDIPVTHDVAGHRFTATVEQHESDLEYAVHDNVMAILHTRVPAPVSGRGIAAAMTVAALNYAKAQSWKILPRCAYATGFFHRHPEYADMLA